MVWICRDLFEVKIETDTNDAMEMKTEADSNDIKFGVHMTTSQV